MGRRRSVGEAPGDKKRDGRACGGRVEAMWLRVGEAVGWQHLGRVHGYEHQRKGHRPIRGVAVGEMSSSRRGFRCRLCRWQWGPVSCTSTACMGHTSCIQFLHELTFKCLATTHNWYCSHPI